MKTISFGELKRLTFCNSKKLMGTVFIIGGTPHEWVGIGMVECEPNPKWAKRKMIVKERGTE